MKSEKKFTSDRKSRARAHQLGHEDRRIMQRRS
jgi:hypothetical protein